MARNVARENAGGLSRQSLFTHGLPRNITATSNPGVNDDINGGYSVGSIWVNVSSDAVYFCADSADGAAVWALAGSSTLTEITALSDADSNFIVGNGSAWVAESGATLRTSVGVGTGDSPQFTGIELSHATANTLTASGGNLSIEGNVVYRAGGTDVAVTDGGTGASSLSNLITLTTHTTGNYVATVTGGTGIDSTGATSGEGIAHSLSLDLSELSDTAIANGDYIVFTDTTDSNATVKGDLADVATLFAGTGLTASSSVIGVDASQTQITAVGTIATGVWEGTTVAVDQGGTGATSLSNLITLATHTTGDYVQNITGGVGIDSTGATSGENIAHSLSIDLAEVGEVAIADGDYIAFIDTTDSSATKKEAIADVATLFAGTGLTASSSVIGVDASQTQVTAVGTIATGTWEATDVGVAHGGTGVSTLLTNAILTGNGASAIQAETDLLFASNVIYPTATAHDTAGKVLTISAGDTTAGTTNNIAGGALTLQGGQGKGSGAGGAIIFQTADGGSSGSSINSLATALTINDDLSITTAGTIELGHASDTTIARASSGEVNIEGNRIYRAGGTDVAIADGGTGAGTATAGFDALSPMTAEGDVLYGGSSGTVTKLAKGSDADVLTLASGVPSWATPTTGDITGVTAGVGLSGGGSSGAVTLTLDLSELSTVTPADGDFFSTLDSDGSNEQKTTTTALATLLAGTGLTASSSVIGVDAAQTQITSIGTQAANVAVGDGYGVVIGTATQETVSIGDGATDLVPELQVLGTAAADSSMLLAAFSTTATTAGSPILAFAKGGNATLGSHTVVTDGEELGNIIAFGDDGTDLETPAASIQFEVDGTPGSGDMPGRIVFSTTADGATVVTERLRIGKTGLVTFANGLAVGSDAEGDILYHNGTSYVRLAKGSDNQTLMMDGNVPNWETAGTGITAGFAIAMAIAL